MEEKDGNTNELLDNEVLERVNIGVAAVSLSMYDEGMTLEELAEVTGINESSVKDILGILAEKGMVKKKITSDVYIVINFKKLLHYLVENGLVFPLSDLK
ncbi:MAG: helix-turn-helix domain-containing protein [Candidatus Heimdallarchaeota archaeon]|nr:helix-turn-helix domain-containing protein [Candidatus Heimdallarchaeota archaeon]